LAESNIVKAGLSSRVEFKKADAGKIPYQENTFDLVLNINMVHLVNHPVRMLDEIERVLKPGGHFFIADVRRSWIGILEKGFKSALTVKEAKNIIKETGLREGHITSAFFWWRYETPLRRTNHDE